MHKTLTGMVGASWLWLVGLTVLAWAGRDVRRHNFEAAGMAFGLSVLLLAVAHLRRIDGGHASSRHGDSLPPWAVHVVPAVLAAASFLWTAWLGPLSDDFVLARWAQDGTWVPASWSFVRPLPLALWHGALSLSRSLSDGWAALHLLNLLLHASNSALLARIGAAWLGPRAGMCAGALFAMFPASVEAVAWNAGIFDLASTTCALGAVAIAQAMPPTTARTCAIGTLIVAGLVSKETAIAIPALVLMIAVLTGMPRSRPRLVQLGFAGGVALLYLVVRTALTSEMAGHLQHLPVDRRQWKDLLVRPFAALAVPIRSDLGLSPDAYLAGLLVLVLFAVAVVHVVRAEPTPQNRGNVAAVLLVGMTWVSLSTLPLLSSFYVAATLEGSRYLYLPAAGWALALSSGLVPSELRWATRVGWTAAVLLLLLFAGRIVHERQRWLDAARIRDRVLTDAASLAHQMSCRSIEVQDPPDNVRGVFVFRQGLPQALAPLTDGKGANPCILRWTGSRVVAVAGP